MSGAGHRTHAAHPSPARPAAVPSRRESIERDVLEFVRRELAAGAAVTRETPLIGSGRVTEEALSGLAAFVQLRTGARLPPGPPDPAVFGTVASIAEAFAEDSSTQVVNRQSSIFNRQLPSRSRALRIGSADVLLSSGRGVWALRGAAACLLARVDGEILRRVARYGGSAIEGAVPPGGPACPFMERMLRRGSGRLLTLRALRRGGPPPWRPLVRQRLVTVRHVAGRGNARAFQWSWIRDTQELAADVGIGCRWRETEAGVVAVGRGDPENPPALAEMHAHPDGMACAVFFLEPWVATRESRVRCPMSGIRTLKP